MISRASSGVVGCLVLLLVPAAAPRAEPGDRVQKVKRLYEQLYYREAMVACEAALRAGHNSRANLISLLGFKGLIAASSGREAVAVEAFKRLLSVEAKAKLGAGLSPRIRRAYEAARRWSARHPPLALTLQSPETVGRRGTFGVVAEVRADPLAMVSQLVLRLRAGGTTSYAAYSAPPGRTASWAIRLAAISGLSQARVLELYVVALDREGNQVWLLGHATEPRTIALEGAPALVAVPPPLLVTPPAPPPPVARRSSVVRAWWFWSAIGAGVALATGLAVGLATRSPPDRVDARVTLETAP